MNSPAPCFVLQAKFRKRLKEFKALSEEERAKLAKVKDGVTKFLTEDIPLKVIGPPAAAERVPSSSC